MTDKTKRRLERIEAVIGAEKEPPYDIEIAFRAADGTITERRMLSSFMNAGKNSSKVSREGGSGEGADTGNE